MTHQTPDATIADLRQRLDAAESRAREVEHERDTERSRFASWAETFTALVVEIERQPGEWGHIRHRVVGSLSSAASQFKTYAAGMASPSNFRKRAEAAESRLVVLEQALREMLDASDDPNAVTGEFDTTAGRARRALDAAALSPKEPQP